MTQHVRVQPKVDQQDVVVIVQVHVVIPVKVHLKAIVADAEAVVKGHAMIHVLDPAMKIAPMFVPMVVVTHVMGIPPMLINKENKAYNFLHFPLATQLSNGN